MSKRLLPKAYAALLCYLGLMPLYLLPAAALLKERLWFAAVLPVPALALTGLAGLRPAKRRTLSLILAMVLMGAACAALFLPTEPLGLLLFLPCAVSMLFFMPAMARPAHQEWSIKHLGAGLVLHIAAQLLKGVAMFEPAAAPLSWIFVAYLLAFLFFCNRTTITDTGSASVKPLLMQNRKLLVVFCLAALLLANIKPVAAALRTAIQWIIKSVMVAVVWLLSLFQAKEAGPMGAQQAGNPLEGLMEDTEPSVLARIFEILLIIVAALVAAALLFLAFKYLFRLLRRAFAAVMDKLKLFRQRISADYEDQSETLLDWGEIRKTTAARLHRVRNRLLPTPWEKLSPAQRVRRVYQLLLRRAQTPDPALTAQEMLKSGALRLPNEAAPTAAALYDRARYSSHPISAREADELRRHAGV